MSEISASAHPGGTLGVRATLPMRECRSENCEIRSHIGVFFDGTGNNQDWVENPSVNWRKGLINWWNEKPANRLTQLQQRSDSDVARLFRAYRDDPQEGYFRVYVPGVGTPFPEIGEDEPDGLGAAFGAGGDGRINYGLLHVLNSMYAAISNNRPMIPAGAVKALCSTGPASINGKTGEPNLSRAQQDALRPVGMQAKGGLLMDNFHQGNRVAFFTEQFARLAGRIAATPKPQLVEVFIDVFGFSRGAAQAGPSATGWSRSSRARAWRVSPRTSGSWGSSTRWRPWVSALRPPASPTATRAGAMRRTCASLRAWATANTMWRCTRTAAPSRWKIAGWGRLCRPTAGSTASPACIRTLAAATARATKGAAPASAMTRSSRRFR